MTVLFFSSSLLLLERMMSAPAPLLARSENETQAAATAPGIGSGSSP
jgi:hypothetical protein